MSELLQNMQMKFKTGSRSLATVIVRLLTGLFLGMALAIVFQELFGFGLLLFWFVILLTTVVFLKISKSWTLVVLFVFNLICILLGLLVRMYIVIAPG